MALRNFHWNIEGPSFFELHNVYEKQYDAIKERIDALAERIKFIGYYPVAKYSTILLASRLSEPELPMDAKEMNLHLVRNLKQLQSSLRTSIDVAVDHKDSVTEDMLISLKAMLDEQCWMLSAWLK